MNEFSALRMVDVTAGIEYVEKAAIFHSNVDAKWSPGEILKVKNALEKIVPDLDFLSLPTTKGGCERLIREIDSMSVQEVWKRGEALKHVLNDELKGFNFYLLDKIRIRFYNNTSIAGEQFKTNFPKANGELIEAGNCLVLNRYTASVCHLMRGMEFGLKAFEKVLAIPSPPNGPENTWGKILGRIEQKKGEKGKKGKAPILPSPEWSKDPDFYEKCHTFLVSVKNAYRDKTFHVESVYDESQANKIFEVAVVFFSQIAEKLEEIK